MIKKAIGVMLGLVLTLPSTAHETDAQPGQEGWFSTPYILMYSSYGNDINGRVAASFAVEFSQFSSCDTAAKEFMTLISGNNFRQEPKVQELNGAYRYQIAPGGPYAICAPK